MLNVGWVEVTSLRRGLYSERISHVPPTRGLSQSTLRGDGCPPSSIPSRVTELGHRA